MKMRNTKIVILVIATVFALAYSGCSEPNPGVGQLSEQLEKLQVSRSGGRVETISFAQAMDWHHKHETPHAHASESAHSHEHDDDDEICVGIATGYQAIRFATGKLFAGQTPGDSDFEMSVAGAMRGVWDVMTLYAGRKLNRSQKRQKKMSLAGFVFTAKRLSNGATLTFSLRPGLIPAEFFAMKNRGVTCGDAALERLKKKAALKILSLPPEECFEILQ